MKRVDLPELRLLRRGLLTLVLLAVPASFAQEGASTFRVEEGAGSLTLQEELAEAAAEWNRGAGESVILRGQDDGPLIRFGDPELMGPDLVSLTLAPEQADLEVLVHPGLYRDYQGSLLHELGLVLGLPTSRSGVMDPLLDPSASVRIGEDEINQLRSLRDRTPGDLDGDGVVGLADLAALGRAFGQRGVNLPADLDGNGIVGSEDVEILRSGYQFVIPQQVAPEQAEDPQAQDEAESLEETEPVEETVPVEETEPVDETEPIEETEPETTD